MGLYRDEYRRAKAQLELNPSVTVKDSGFESQVVLKGKKLLPRQEKRKKEMRQAILMLGHCGNRRAKRKGS